MFRFYQSFILTQFVGLNSKKALINTLKYHNNISMIGTEVRVNIFQNILQNDILFYNLFLDRTVKIH